MSGRDTSQGEARLLGPRDGGCQSRLSVQGGGSGVGAAPQDPPRKLGRRGPTRAPGVFLPRPGWAGRGGPGPQGGGPASQMVGSTAPPRQPEPDSPVSEHRARSFRSQPGGSGCVQAAPHFASLLPRANGGVGVGGLKPGPASLWPEYGWGGEGGLPARGPGQACVGSLFGAWEGTSPGSPWGR